MPSKEPSVTVLVTVKNSSRTVKKCIDSILRLNYRNKKVFVTDAYSTDGTWEILLKYGKRIRLERVKGNIAAGHNYMISKCNTEFVALTDADCVVDRNWLRKLIGTFTSEDVIASGGMVKTPSNINKLQQLIGRELEDRFRSFPNYVSRLPTISLCIRTEYAKKIPFDEDMDVAQETDWGYRANKIGKIAFVPDAVVYHYHRAKWWDYIKQQYTYAKFTPMLYFKKGHKEKAFGDEISKTSMLIQISLLYLAILPLLLVWILFILLGQFNNILLQTSTILFILLLFNYFLSSIRLSKNIADFLLYLIIFFIRNIAWCLGIAVGFVKFK